jgi:outer membrane immunogenic protein
LKRFFRLLTSGSAALLLLPSISIADPLSEADWSGTYFGGNLDFHRGVPDGSGLISVHAGIDRAMGNTVLGGEVEVSDADAGAPGGTIDWMTRGKLRAGMAYGRTLVYATAGGVRAESSTGPEYGLLAGAGIEYQLIGRWTVGGEVLTHHFPNFDGAESYDVQTVSARVSFRF